MSMTAATHDEEDGLYNPDEEQVPESSLHRQTSVLIEVAVTHLVGSSGQVRANLNWYPTDGKNAVAPDVMVFTEPAMATNATSYYQRSTGGPTPIAVVEVPSDRDTVPAFAMKQARYHGLGTTVYVVDPYVPHVTRYAADGDEARKWLGRPCPELGGLVFKVDGERLVVWLPGGLEAGSADELLGLIEARAETAEARAVTAEARAEALAARLRAAGLDDT